MEFRKVAKDDVNRNFQGDFASTGQAHAPIYVKNPGWLTQAEAQKVFEGDCASRGRSPGANLCQESGLTNPGPGINLDQESRQTHPGPGPRIKSDQECGPTNPGPGPGSNSDRESGLTDIHNRGAAPTRGGSYKGHAPMVYI